MMRTQGRWGQGRRDGPGELRGHRIAQQRTDWEWKSPGAAGQRWNQFLGWIEPGSAQFGSGQHAMLMRHPGGA